jgi:hypothetical protein
MEHLGAPFVWSIVAVLGIAVAAGMIAYGIYAIRKNDKPEPLYGGVTGTLKEDWARTGNIDFHVAALESASPQHFILRVEERKIMENPIGQEISQLRWRLATMEEAKEVVACWSTHSPKTR